MVFTGVESMTRDFRGLIQVPDKAWLARKKKEALDALQERNDKGNC